jgi:hypothetical protein
MGVLRSLARWLKRLFRKTEDTLISVDENDAYEETLISYLETLPKGRKEMKLKKNGSRFSWKGEISSMIDAYLFLIRLPSVCPDNITHHVASDCLIYHAQLNENQQLTMRERFVRGNRMVDLKLNSNHQPIVVRLLFKQSQTYEENHYLRASASACHCRNIHRYPRTDKQTVTTERTG